MSRTLPAAVVLILVAGLPPAVTAAPLSPRDEANAEQTEQGCKLTVRGQTAKARANYIQSCVAQISPTLGYWEHCRQSAQTRHLKGLAFRDDMNACMARMP